MTGQQTAPLSDKEAVPHQVLCVTHLPQLAAFGDKHFTVTKRIQSVNGEERTSTVVAEAIGAVPNTQAADWEFACKAGT